MQAFPHHYAVTATARSHGDVVLTSEGPSPLFSASPPQFDGSGDLWSPETLLAAAVGDCLILTFRAIARASNFPWTALRCDVTGTLDRIDGVTQFTSFDVRARLDVPAGSDPERARRLLEKAERTCLISNSLKGAICLTPEVEVVRASVDLVTV